MMPETHVPTMDEHRARRMVRDLVQGEMDAGTEGGADLRAPAVAALAAAAGAMLAMLHFSGDAVGARGEQNSPQTTSVSAQHTEPGGLLPGMQTNHTIAIPLAAAAIVSSSLCAAPPGYVLVADSQAQFSGEQGRDGWWYLFDRGPKTDTSEIPYFVDFGGSMVWCGSTVAGNGGGYCIVSSTSMHPNTGSNCNTTGPGDQHPIREWRSAVPMRAIVQLTGIPNTLSPGMRIDLLANQVLVGSWTSMNGSIPTIDVTIDVGLVQSIDVRLDALGSCHMDSFNHAIRVYTPDCNTNNIADYLDIAADPTLDRDHDGALDSCQCAAHPELCCPADLTRDGQVNGADLGAVLAFWGPNPAYPQADLNGDGRVDGADLGTLLANWGPCGQ
jgi:hypothetical protein